MTHGLCLPSIRGPDSDLTQRSPEVPHRAEDPSQSGTKAGSPTENDADEHRQTNEMESADTDEIRNTTQTNFDACHDALVPQHTWSTPLGVKGSSGFPRADLADGFQPPNIIIFGETGVGKSSVINLIAGQKRAHISNDALGCTFQYQRHTVLLDGMLIAFWDTAGLDEGSEGMVPAKLAEGNLRVLMQRLAHSGGIHLIIYCIRGGRLTRTLKHNYDLFYIAICRKKVPVALVVTGLEYQQGEVDSWWDENKAALQRCGMWFDAHACVTTLDVDEPIIQARRLDSQRRLRDIVLKYAERPPWKIELSLSLTLFRNIFRGGASSTERKTTRRVLIYDCTTSRRTCMRSIGDRQLEYELVYVKDPLVQPTTRKLVGLLVFYTSTILDSGISRNDVDALKKFYDVAGGRTCPVIVILRGCSNDRVAQRYWDAVASQNVDIQACPLVDEPVKLDAAIEKRCIEHVEGAKASGPQRAWEVFTQLVSAMFS